MLSPSKKILPLIAVFVALLGLCGCPAKKVPTAKDGSYFFCSWNVENFYDDQADPKNDDKLENWFAKNPDKFRLKVDRLSDALLMMNDGTGPDIMALYEVENENCLNALKTALNDKLAKKERADQKYEHVLFVIDKTGRRFAPGIITRLPIEGNRTHKFAKHPNGRTLEGHIKVNGHDLIVLAAHWTSRVNHNGHADNNAARRMSYAHDCYGHFRAILTNNPDADVILCGDFNDEFGDASIRDGLHASDNVDEVKDAIVEPRPLALFANWSKSKDPPGTIYGKSHWSIFDHICVSRGLLDDKGWVCDLNSAAIFAPKELRKTSKRSHGEPYRFGDEHSPDHGYSDHFPISVRINVK